MDRKEIIYFTETEGAAIQLIRDLGFKRSFARVLVYLLRKPDSTIRDIERGADLRQSDVSLATAELLKRRWISCRLVPGVARRRPVKVFNLALSVPEIIASIEEKKRREADAVQVALEKLKTLVRKSTPPAAIMQSSPTVTDISGITSPEKKYAGDRTRSRTGKRRTGVKNM